MLYVNIGINQCTRALERAYKQQCQYKNKDNPNDSVTNIISITHSIISGCKAGYNLITYCCLCKAS